MPCRPRIMPPVGKSGPGTMPMRSSIDSPGSSISATQASTTSPRLCGGMFVAIPMILADHVADDARRLHVLLVGRMPLLVHRIENAAMHRLEAVARVRQRTRHDHAHGVIEIRALHLVRDRDGPDVRGLCGLLRLVVFVVSQGENSARFSTRFI